MGIPEEDGDAFGDRRCFPGARAEAGKDKISERSEQLSVPHSI